LRHEVERSLKVLEHLGGRVTTRSTELWLVESDIKFANKWWRQNGLSDKQTVIACAPGSKKQKCRWPEAEYAKLVEDLWQRYSHNLTVLLICSPDERHLAKSIASATAAKVLAPITNNVRHAAALIRRCSLLVGNNSGPIHLAAAAGIAVVEISCHPIGGDPYDEVNPARFGAYTENCIVVQPERATEPCVAKCESPSPHCIKKVNWMEVSEAVQALLKRQTNVRMGESGDGA